MTITIKMRANPYYTDSVSLDGATYKRRIHWNILTAKWYMDVDGLNNSVSIKGIAVLPGKDLFAPYGYSGQLGTIELIDNTNTERPENPTYDDMGTRWTLEYTPLG